MNYNEEKLLKKIFKEANYRLPSDDFNDRVISRLKAFPTKVGISNHMKISLLYNTLIIVLVFSGLVSYLNQTEISTPVLQYIKALNVDVITVFTGFIVFSFYILISEFIDKRIFH